MKNRLITIGPSHYCEKARWALTRGGVPFVEEMYAPMLHAFATLRSGGGRTVPVLVTADKTYADSTDILEFVDRETKGALYGDASQREEVKALEDVYDRRVGPATRRLVYWHLLDTPGFTRLFDHGLSRAQRTTLKLLRPGVRLGIRRGLRVNQKGAARSRARLREVLDDVKERLADGRRYLMGERFTAADLTFASLASPMILPPKYGYPLPGDMPGALRQEIDELRNTPAGRFVLRIYDEERSSSPSDTL
jgi:glutathione S-transferase